VERRDTPSELPAEDDDLALERALFNVDDDDFSLFRAAALLPRIEGRRVDLDALDEAVQTIADRVRARLQPSAAWPAPVTAIVETMFRELGFQGDGDVYDAPRNSFLDDVVERRRGLPIALSVLTCEVARRAGIDAHGIAFPGHFLVGVRDRAQASVELVVLDPFHRGRLLSQKHLEQQLFQLTGKPVELTAEHLAPASPEQVLVRMINNLRGSYLRRQDPLRLSRALSRLLVLRPKDAAALVERAETRRELLDAAGAAQDAEAGLAEAPNARIAARAKKILQTLADDARFAS
jgi:regulator of sirC expression with transglutaminase-like and TPR domain